MTSLTPDNYSKGFLIDDDLLGGITPHPDQPGVYVAFVLRHTTGEYLGYQPFSTLIDALQVINQIQRPWSYEQISGCGGGNCGKEGGCSKGSCRVGKCGPEPC